MIRFPCPSCGHTLKVADEAAGKTGKCRCGELVRIPTPNPFEQAEEERGVPRPTLPAPERHPEPLDAPPAPVFTPPRGEMIFCYACRKQVADTAPICPKCGAVQTAEGREKGRQIKKWANVITAIIVCV